MDMDKSISSSIDDESEQLESSIVVRRVWEANSEPGLSDRERLALGQEQSWGTPGDVLPATMEGGPDQSADVEDAWESLYSTCRAGEFARRRDEWTGTPGTRNVPLSRIRGLDVKGFSLPSR